MTTRRATGTRTSTDVLIIAAFVAAGATVAVAYLCWWAAIRVTSDIPVPGWTEFTQPAQWPGLATVFVSFGETLLVAAALTVWLRGTRRHELERRAKVMASPRKLSEVTGHDALTKARRLRPDAQVVRPSDIGVELGKTIVGGIRVYMSWEDVGTVMGGPRTRKTQSLAVGAICAAPGPVIATSNKRDLHDHTRGVRERGGRRAWVSDLQGRTGIAHQDWWWDILAGIDRLPTARKLMGHFEASTKTTADARSDSYFEGGALELAALTVLAASVGGGDLLHAYGWLTDEDSRLPAQLLDQSGHAIAASKLRAVQGLNSRQRDGLYDMARRLLNVLSDDAYARTVLPPQRRHFEGDDSVLGKWDPNHALRQFDPEAFVTSTDALYLMSLEGEDSATPLITALVGRILDHALKVATRSPGGRLPTPLLGVLDEAANVCKLKELPSLYSHLGSQGVVLLTFLQSPAQAAEVWTPNQLAQLIAASNVHYYAGGVHDTKYLQGLCDEIGASDVERWTHSSGRGGTSRSQSWSHEPLVPVNLLAELPKNCALIITTGNPPVLVHKSSWTDGPYADVIRASLARYEPKPAKELLKEAR